MSASRRWCRKGAAAAGASSSVRPRASPRRSPTPRRPATTPPAKACSFSRRPITRTGRSPAASTRTGSASPSTWFPTAPTAPYRKDPAGKRLPPRSASAKKGFTKPGAGSMAYLVGAGLALVVAAFAALTGLDRDRAFYATVLIVVAHYYDLFAV